MFGCRANAAELLVTISSNCALDSVETALATVTQRPDGVCQARWERGSVPEILPYISDPHYLKSEHLLLTVKRKGGQVAGYADLSLLDAFHYLTSPIVIDQLSLSTVIDHPVLSRVWSAHCTREMTNDNLAFFKATRAFQHWVAKRKSL
jgi:hypothetical protein